MRKIFFVFILLLLISTIAAADVGFIVGNSAKLDSNEIILKDFLISEGHTVSIIDDSALSVDKQIIIVSFSANTLAFDISQHKAIIMSNKLAKEAGLARSYGSTSGPSINIEKIDFITEEYSLGSTNVYTSSSPINYIVSCFASGSRNLAYKSDKSRSVILIADPTVKLLNSQTTSCSGVKQNTERLVFFGVTDTQKWNSDAKELFRRSIMWLLTGGQTDKDNDGYYSLVSGGNDCDDNDPSINPASADINKNCKNDAPIIETFDPSGNQKLLKNKDKEFKVTVSDETNSVLTHTWKVDDTDVGVGTRYIFNRDVGDYVLSYTVSDGEFISTKSWNIQVRQSTEFSCTEVAGFSCSAQEICKGTIIAVKDNSLCCQVACSEKPPEFVSIRKRCQNESSSIDLTLDDFADDDFSVANIADYNVRIKNNLNEKKDFTIYTALYDVTKEKELKNQERKIDINKGAIIASFFEFVIPDNIIEENEFAFFTYVEAESGECKEVYRKIDAQRKSDTVIVEDVDFKNELYLCGDTLDIDVKAKNLARETETVYISLKSDLFEEKTESFTIGKYGEDNTESKKFIVTIPETAQKGTYDIAAEVHFNGKTASLKDTINLGECEIQEILDDEVDTITLKSVSSYFTEETKEPTYIIIGVVYIFIFLFALIVFYFTLRKR